MNLRKIILKAKGLTTALINLLDSELRCENLAIAQDFDSDIDELLNLKDKLDECIDELKENEL